MDKEIVKVVSPITKDNDQGFIITYKEDMKPTDKLFVEKSVDVKPELKPEPKFEGKK